MSLTRFEKPVSLGLLTFLFPRLTVLAPAMFGRISLTLAFGLTLCLPSFGQSFEKVVQPFIATFCAECHAGDDPSGDVDLAFFQSNESAIDAFEVWGKVNELLEKRKMPPEEEPQPSQAEVDAMLLWYQQTFVDSVKARPGTFRPRRLSATEYRNTLRSLFGFDLEVNIMEAEQTVSETSLVMKLLPTDPPGKSRYRNDTLGNPLTTQIWEQYSYLTDTSLEELFSPHRTQQLAALAGDIEGGFDERNADTLIRWFLPKIYRRPVNPSQLEDVLLRITESDNSGNVAAATRRELKRALLSPQFLYRGLLMTTTPGKQQLVDDFELAERLSYLVWADMPDEELMRVATEGKLQDTEVLRSQVTRMLDSPKASSLATDFAVQWLLLDEISHVSDNPPQMVALMSQPIDFFSYLISDDRPLMELLDSKTTFANPLTRRYYLADTAQMGKYRRPTGVEIEIVPNQKLTLQNTAGRGGLLTMPGVLAMNRGPILRGVWMLERILGEHLPDPPADVGQVQANVPGEHVSFRERFAQHRENESCALCHDKIDPLGFSFEAYDEKGGYILAKDYKKSRKQRRNEAAVTEIDASGRLPSGETFRDFSQLKQILLTTQRNRIIRNFVKQMLAYALCRKLEIYDQPTVETIVRAVDSSDATWRELIFEVVNSLPFREAYVPHDE